jgi:hypothetical protein
MHSRSACSRAAQLNAEDEEEADEASALADDAQQSVGARWLVRRDREMGDGGERNGREKGWEESDELRTADIGPMHGLFSVRLGL